MTTNIDGASLGIEQLVEVARGRDPIVLADAARSRIARGRAIVDATFRSGRTVYGLNTGVGVLKRAGVEGDVAQFNRRMLEFHQLAQGPLHAKDVVRGATCRLINQFASGASGVRPELVDHLVAQLNRDHPVAVHADGDLLLSNADLALGLVGDFPLSHGEALTLLGHTMLTDAQAALILADLDHLVAAMEAAAAVSLEAFQARLTPLDPRIAASKKLAGLAESSANIVRHLSGSTLFDPSAPRNLQDPTSFRCANYLLGALRDCLAYTRDVVGRQLNSSAGNPVVDVDSGEILHAPNWEVQNLTTALDFVKIALVPPAMASHERGIKLLDRFWSGLPTGLVGTAEQAESGLAMYQILLKSYALKVKSLAASTSYEITSTSQAEGIEDRETGGVQTAASLVEMIEQVQKLVAIELAIAAQAVELRQGTALGAGIALLVQAVRQSIPFVRIGDALPRDFTRLIEAIRSGAMVAGG